MQLDKRSIEVLAQVPKVIRTLASENAKLTEQLTEFKKVAEAEEIITTMEERGISDRTIPFKRRVAELLNSKKDLNLVKEAMTMATPAFSFAAASDVPDPENDQANALEAYLMSGDE